MAPLPLSAQLRAAGTRVELDRVCDCGVDFVRSWFPAVHLADDQWTVLGRPIDLEYYDRNWADAQAWLVLPATFDEHGSDTVGEEGLVLIVSRS